MPKISESSRPNRREQKTGEWVRRKEQKSERMAVRLVPAAKERLEYAARATGRSLSDFVVSSALDAAERHIERSERFRLLAADRAVFLSALAKPPAPNAALRAAARKYRERTRG